MVAEGVVVDWSRERERQVTGKKVLLGLFPLSLVLPSEGARPLSPSIPSLSSPPFFSRQTSFASFLQKRSKHGGAFASARGHSARGVLSGRLQQSALGERETPPLSPSIRTPAPPLGRWRGADRARPDRARPARDTPLCMCTRSRLPPPPSLAVVAAVARRRRRRPPLRTKTLAVPRRRRRLSAHPACAEHQRGREEQGHVRPDGHSRHRAPLRQPGVQEGRGRHAQAVRLCVLVCCSFLPSSSRAPSPVPRARAVRVQPANRPGPTGRIHPRLVAPIRARVGAQRKQWARLHQKRRGGGFGPLCRRRVARRLIRRPPPNTQHPSTNQTTAPASSAPRSSRPS